MNVTRDVDGGAWDAYVAGHPEATGYHQWLWRRVFDAAFGHEAAYFAATEGGRIVGVLPTVMFESRLFGRFLVSLPFVNYGGVLADTPEVADALVRAASLLAAERRLQFVELRHRRRMLPALAVKNHKVSMLLALEPDEGRAWDGLDRKVRNQVRKAAKSGLTGSSGGVDLLGQFYSVFSHNMRDLGTPVYGARFFDAVLRHAGPSARVFVVCDGRQCAAAAIAYRFRDVVEVPWASCLRSYRTLAANVQLYWNVITQAIADGAKTLDFGRSTPGEGTFNFKKQWGAVPMPLAWEYWLPAGAALPDLSPRNPRFEQAIALWKRLPVAVTTLIGPSIVRNIP